MPGTIEPTPGSHLSGLGRALLIGGGAVLGAFGLQRASLGGYAVAAAGVAIAYQGVRTNRAEPRAISVERSMTIYKPRNEVYAFWRRLENLPRYMTHLANVRAIDEKRSEWSFDAPGLGRRLSWTAEIIRESEDRNLAWSSLPGGDVIAKGEILFRDAPGERGTELFVHLEYVPPGGFAGRLAARALNPAFERLVGEDVRRVKHVLEAGEIPSTEGQPSGR